MFCAKTLLAFLAGILLASNTLAIDPGTAQGSLVVSGSPFKFTHAYAHLHREVKANELRILLTDRELEQSLIAGSQPIQLQAMVEDGKLQGLLFRLDPDRPEKLGVTLLQPSGSKQGGMPRAIIDGRRAIKRLSIGGNRVLGDIEAAFDASPESNRPAFEFSVHFSAPLFRNVVAARPKWLPPGRLARTLDGCALDTVFTIPCFRPSRTFAWRHGLLFSACLFEVLHSSNAEPLLPPMNTEILTLQNPKQRLQLIPQLGGSIAGWEWNMGQRWTPLLRAWDGASDDRYSFACFPLTPWSNRITQGGFEHTGVFHPVKPNRIGEAYPIHGDGWLQAWRVDRHESDSVQLALASRCFDGNPYEYAATQSFTLLPDGMAIDLSVTHLGVASLPYGLGLHPYFLRNDATRLQAKCSGVWLAGADPIPVEHTEWLPRDWDYQEFAPIEGTLIDNCFTGWDGVARIHYPDRGLSITMNMADCNGYSLMYRPPDLDYFCLEPITHPIDAFHLPGRPGLAILEPGQSLSLRTTLRIAALRN
ncbi:hypothetical protein BH11PSE11_BH11PSE11_28800 [soil metagenome]